MTPKAEALRQRQLREDRRALIEDARYCRVLADVIADCGPLHQSYRGGDTHATAFNEGRRSIGLALIAAHEAVNPEALAVLRRHMTIPNTEDARDE